MSETEQPSNPASAADKYPLATRLQRFIAVLIDEIIALAILIPIVSDSDYMKNIQQGQVPTYTDALLLNLAMVLLFILLHSYFLNRYGQTIGKRIVGVAIVNISSGRILPLSKVIILRYLPLWLASVIPFTSLVVPLFDALFIFRPDRRCIHDHIAGTKVIDVRAARQTRTLH